MLLLYHQLCARVVPHISSQLEKKLYSIFKESGDLDFPEEDWVFQVLPELNDLEADTLDTLMAQAQAHAKYERAARELVLHERAKLDAEHAQEIRSLRAQFESESTRTSVSSEMRLKQLGTKAAEEQEELRKEAQEKIAELEEVIEQLEAQVEAKDKELREVAEEAEEEVERLKDEKFAAAEKLRAAEEETDLKREASRKLKEEIIDNDRLTVANLNRIKQLEATVEQHKEALKEVEHENEDLRAELEKAAALGRRRPRRRRGRLAARAAQRARVAAGLLAAHDGCARGARRHEPASRRAARLLLQPPAVCAQEFALAARVERCVSFVGP